MAYLGEDIPKLGFGLMRLPKLADGSFNQELINQMVDEFMANGFRYFDTAWMYDGSEEATRKALVERYPRDSYLLATKLAAWCKTGSKEEAEAQFETSLRRTGAGYFDFYLLHNVGEERAHFFDDWNLWDFVQEKKKQGLIRHVGMSMHGPAEELDRTLTAHPEMEFVQLQINYADWKDDKYNAEKLYNVARKHNKPIIIMGPLKGCLLAEPPENVKELFRTEEPDSTPASWAMRFAVEKEGIITVLSGMNSMEQMRDNINTVKNFKGLDEKQKAVYEEAQKLLAEKKLIQCTSCEYCVKACPADIGISGSFTAYNMFRTYDNLEFAKTRERVLVLMSKKKLASECIGCGACEKVCPQKLPVMELLKTVKETFKQE